MDERNDVIVIPEFKIGKSSVFEVANALQNVIAKLDTDKCTVYHQYESLLMLIINEGCELENYNKYKESVNNGI